MTSTTSAWMAAARSYDDWRPAGLRYYAYSFYLRRRFGHRVQRISIDAGFGCPNRDGTVASGGCIFCDDRSFSPSRRMTRRSIGEQIEEGIRRVRRRYRCDHFIAYFQPATNTYAPVERLRDVYEQALAHPNVVGIAIGTRPDVADDRVLDLLGAIAQRTYVSVEYGMQTMHDRSLDWLNRRHHHDAFVDAVQRSRGRGFEIGAHVILGLPGESDDDMMATAHELARLRIDSVKLHNLYAVRNTPLASLVQRGEVVLMERHEYVRALADFLERLPPTVIIQRLSGDAPPEFLVAPSWCLDKAAVRSALDELLRRRDSWQGRCL